MITIRSRSFRQIHRITITARSTWKRGKKKKDDGKTLKKDEDKIFEKIDDLIDSHTDEYLSELCDIEVGQFIKVNFFKKFFKI